MSGASEIWGLCCLILQTEVTSIMSDRKRSSWFYPKPTGDPGRDRNAGTVQFACFLLASAVSAVAVLNSFDRGPSRQSPLLLFAVAGLVAATVINRAGRWEWAARIAILAILFTAILLVFAAHDGFRSTSMLIFPLMLLLSVMLLDRASYMVTAGIILLAVAGLGIAERQGLTRAIPRVRSPTTYESIFFVDLDLLVFALIGSRIARDSQSNVFDLRTSIDRLSAANLELRAIMDAAPAAILVTHDAEACRISGNRTAYTVLRRPPGSNLSMTAPENERPNNFRILRDGVEIPPVQLPTRRAALTGQPVRSELLEVRFDDGTAIDLLGNAEAILDDNGRPQGAVAVLSDVTASRQAEAALRESEECFRRVFEEGPLGLALVGRDYRFVKVNSALCRMVDYDEEQLIRLSFVEITHPDDVGTDVELAEKLFKHEIPFYRLQKRYVKKNGQIIWINLTASMIFDPDGKPMYGLAMIEDITEIKRNQEEAFFRRKLESVGTLAGGIAHDFNNLLGAVQAQAELALTELDTGASCKHELETICQVAMRGSEIVRQLMIYAGKESAAVGLVDLSKTADEMLSLLKVSVTKRAVIQADLEPEIPAIRASAAQIRQIVLNLITNASDAIGDRGGVIRLTTRRLVLKGESAALSSGTLPDGEYVQLEVSDTGGGMSRETQAKVFDPTFTTKSPGRGLGLAVVQGIVRSLAGAIHLTSEPDKGTTFRILLPCAESTTDANGQVTSANGEPSVPARHATVLVVEDEDHLRQAVVKMLQNTGFEVLQAADGTTAVDLLRENGNRIDAILLDMTIPGAPSREVVVEAGKVGRDLRIILTSAYSQEMIEGSMSGPQIRGFIRKPFEFADLLKTLRSCLAS
jgi:PAS domain S-box-containing protein